MEMDLLQIMEVCPDRSFDDCPVYGWITFAGDRYAINIQANAAAFCLPRETLPLDRYTHFEVFPQLPAELIPRSWERYIVDNSIYAFVPREEVEALLLLLDERLGMDQPKNMEYVHLDEKTAETC